MEVHTWHFSRPGQDKYKRLCDVFEYSCKKNNLPVFVHEMEVPPVPERGRSNMVPNNHFKLRKWVDKVIELTKTRAGEVILLSDSDMLCQKAPPVSMFDDLVSVGITNRVRPAKHFNAGMIPVRLGQEAIDLFEEWWEKDTYFYENPKAHQPYKRKYYGMNQASLGLLLEQNEHTHRHKPTFYSCADLNLIQPWGGWQQAYFIHVKSGLGDQVLEGPAPVEQTVRKAPTSDPQRTVYRNGKLITRTRRSSSIARRRPSPVHLSPRRKRKAPSDLVAKWRALEVEMKSGS